MILSQSEHFPEQLNLSLKPVPQIPLQSEH